MADVLNFWARALPVLARRWRGEPPVRAGGKQAKRAQGKEKSHLLLLPVARKEGNG